MGIATVSLLVLVLVAVIAVPVLFRVVGVATRRNPNRPDSGGESTSELGTPSNKDIANEAEALSWIGPFLGSVMGVSGVLAGLAGGLFGLSSGLMDNAVPSTSMGIFLGLVGYILGARWLGRVAAIFSAVALIFALSVGQGYVPGLQATDHGLPQKESAAHNSR